MAEWGRILAAGVDGYLKGTQIVAARDRRESDDAYLQESRGRERAKWAEQDAIKSDLKAASAPVGVVEGSNGAVLPETMDARDIGQPGESPLAAAAGAFRVGAQTYADSAAANAAAAAANTPEVIAGRQAQVYQKHGMPAEATALEAKQAALQKTALELKKSGVLEGVNALRQGNKDQAIKALKGSGMFNIDGDVTMEPEEMEVPGIGKIKAYNLKFNTKNPDGTTAPMTLNSHVLALGMMPYEKQLEVMRKGSDSSSRAEERLARIDIAAQRADASTLLAEARAARLAGGGGGGGGGRGASGDREYRLQLQNMTSNVSKEIRELDAGIKDLRNNEIQVPGKPPSTQMQELLRQRSEAVQRRAALNDEFVSLAEKKAGVGNENIAAQRKQTPKTVKTGRGEVPKIETKEQYDKLPSGTVYIAPDGKEMKKK